MPTPTGSPETPEPAQRAGSARSGRRRDRTQHDRRHGEDVVSDEPDSQGETLARARGDSRGQRPADHLTHRPRNASRSPLRRHRRGAPAWAALSLLAGLLGLLLLLSPVAAQSVTTLVSNAGQSAPASRGNTLDRAQAFTTSAGATLSSVEIISEDTDGDDVAVSLCTVDGSNHPTSDCTALTAPSSFAAGTLIFTAPANTTLAANTTYSLLITSPGDDYVLLAATSSDNEDAGGAMGWSIANTYDIKNASNVWRAGTRAFRITINGTLGSTTVTNNAPTVATEIPDQAAMSGTAFSYQVPAATFADADSDTLTYTATLADDTDLPSWLIFDPATSTFSGTPTAAETVSVKVTASDASDSVSDTFDIVVSAATVVSGTTLVSTIEQTDGGGIDTSAPNGAIFTTGSNAATLTSIELRLENTTSAAVTTVPTVHVHTGTVTGGFLTLGTEVAELTGPSSLAAGIHNYTFMAPANTTLEDSSTYYVITGVGGASVKLRYEAVTSSPILDSGGASGWDVPATYVTGADLQVSEGVLRFLIRVNGTVGGTPTNSAPTLATVIPNQTATTGTAFSYQVPAATFADADSDTLTYAATLADDTALPSWLSFAPATRTFSGTPTAAETVSVKVTASDASESVSDTFDIVVGLPADTAMTLVSNATQGSDNSWNDSKDRSQPFTTGAAGATLSSVEIISEDTAGDEFAVSLCTVDGSGYPTSDCTPLTVPSSFAAGTLVFTAPDGTTLAATTTYSLLITSPGVALVKLDATSSDNEDGGGATGWSIADAFDSATSSTVWTSITTSLRITIKGTITNNAPTVATEIPNQTAMSGTAFSYQVPAATFADADSDTLTYTAMLADDTALPAWLSFDPATRTFSGTPTTAETVSVKVTASDGTESVSDSFDFVVSAADTTAPRVASIKRQNPTDSPTNADSLTWRVTFSEAVSNVNAADFAVSGTTATVTVSGTTGAYDVTASGGNLASVSATVTLTITSSHNIEDEAGNALSNTGPTGTNNNSYVLDNTAPTVTISGVPSASTVPFTATFTFSEAVTGFVVGDITLGNATASSFTSTSTTVYTALITPTADGEVTVDVSANAAQDAVTNGNTAATQASSTYTLPAITIVAGTSPVTEGTSAVFTLSRTGSTTAALTVNVTVSETGGDMVAAADEGADTVTFLANATTATLSVTTASDSVDEANSVVTATISADTGSPASYSVGTPSSAMVTVEDNDTRDVTVSTTALTINEGATGTYTVVLNSQPTASVTVTPSKTGSSDVTFSPATLTFTMSNWSTAQTVTVTTAQDSDAVDDSATISHAVTGGDYASLTVDSVVVTVDDDETADTTAPTVASIVRETPTSSPTNADSLTWRVTFSETVSNVDAADFAVSGTTATVTAVAAVSGVTGAYDVTASGGNLASVSATVTLTISSSHNIQDAASNALSNTAPTGTNNNSYVLDNAAPSVTISGVPSASNAPFTATFTFSEAVTGFAVGDITLTNATVSNFTATSTTVYTALVTPTASGTVTVNVSANAAQDAAGNGNTAASLATTTYTPPAITITAGTSPVTEGTSAVFTLSRAGSTTAALTVNVTVSETGGDMVAAADEGAETVNFLANATTATLSVTTASDSVDEANSVVTATVSADTGSPASYSVGTPSSAMVTVEDNDTRDVTVSTTALPVNEGSTGTYTVVLNSQPTASVTVTPSRTGSSDVTFSPATLTFTTSNWSTAQTVTVTTAQDSDAVDDSATISHAVTGGDYASLTVDSVVVTVDDDESADTTAPRVASIVRETPASSPTNADSLTWRVTFSEAVSNVDAADFAVSGTTATVTAVAAVSGVTGGYDVTASGGNLAGVSATVTLTISSSHNIADAATNALTNTAPTGTNNNSYVLDNTAPSVTISGVPSASDAPFTATFTFSEAVTGFAAGDITLTNASASSFTVTSTMVFTALITPAVSGTVTVDVSANAAQDAAGNGNTAAARATSTYTGTAALPAITIAAGASPVTEGTSAVFTLSRTGSTTAALTVNVTVSEAGGDMVAASNEGDRTVTFLTNSTTVTLSIATASDSVAEANSVVTATVAADTGSPASYSVGAPASAMVTVRDNDSNITVPGAPTALSASAAGGTQINLSWTAPTDDGGSPIIGYKIEVSPDGNADWTELVANTGNANTTYEHIGLTVGTSRHYRVSAINSDGVGDPSNIDDATASVPTVTLRTQSVPESIGTAMLVVTLDQPAGNPLSVPWYTLSSTAMSPGDYTNGEGTLIIPSGVTNATISITIIDDAVEEPTETVLVLLSSGTGYDLGGSGATLSILDDDGDGPAPSGATVDGATVVLTYNEPLDGASTPSSTAFVLRVAGNPVSITEVSVDGSEVTLTLAAPVPAGQTVSLDHTQPMSNPIQDASGNKAQSFARWYLVTESTITITNPVITVPGAPTDLSASAVGETQINLSWTAPGENGGAPISGYKIESSPDGVANWTELVANTGNANTTYEHLGLTVGTIRHYRVSAINSEGAGDPSNIDDATAIIPTVTLRTQTVLESIGTALLAVTLDQPAGDPLSVPWYTRSGTAETPNDYTDGEGTLNILSGATNATISITIIDDAVEELTETVLVLLSSGTGYVLGGSGATVSILDDDGDGPAPIRATVNGTTVVLTYNKPLDGASTPSSTAFVLRVAGDPVSINEVSVDGSEVTLTLASPVQAGQTVSLDYTQPMSNPIQDGSGNKAQSFTRWYLVTGSTITGTVDTTAPTVTISGVPATSDAPFTATFTFSEAVTGFAVGDITLGNATASSFTSRSTTVYTALVTPTAAGAVTVDVPANAAQDAAGNGNTAATRASSTYTGSATRGVTVSATVLSVTEGSTGTYTVVLDSQPTANVTVTPSRTGSTDVTFSPATLTFTALNWNTVQPVTVTAAQDSDAVDDSATISHAVTGGDYVGETVESVVVRVNDDESVDTVPGVPTDLSASTGGNTRINLSWTAPGDDGGSPITGYKIEVSPDGNANWTGLVANTGNTTTTYAHIGLAVGTTRHYRVSAINSVGAGDPSNIDDATAEAITVITTGGGGGGGGGGPTPSEVDFEWNVKRDIEELDGGNDWPTGLWSDGETLWIAENGQGADDEVYAYDLASGERVESREFALADTNRAPRGIWSDGETAWVSDSGRERLFAYRLADGERLEEREFELPRENRDARGIWSDEKTMWVLDGRADALFAYDLESGALLAEYELDAANDDPRGIWSDRTTVWVSDHGAKRLFAYRLPAPEGPAAEDAEPQDLERVRDEEFPNTVLSRASNNSPRGIWSDGDVMYVADESDDRVYSYNMPDAIDARLASLTLSGVDIGEFDPRRTEYEAVVADGVTATTVEAEAMQRRTDVDIDPPDIDEAAEGYQVALEDLGEITVTVTSADGSRTKTYRVRLGEEEAAGPVAGCLRGDIAVGFSLVVYAGGSIEDLVACAESRDVAALYVLDGGEWVSYILGAPELVNRSFAGLFAEGLAALTPLIARSDGPASPDPSGDEPRTGDATQPWPACLQGEIAEGFNLVVYEGGSVGELEACAEGVGLAALYALSDGVWVSYIVGAPEFVNRSFAALFADGVPSATPLVGKRDAP